MSDIKTDIVVTILGSGTCVPSLERSSCSVMMEVGGKKLLFDSGPGTMRRMLRAETTIFDISYILYSHLHPDHTAEFVPLLFATKYPAGNQRHEPLTVVAGRGFAKFHNGLRSVYDRWIDIGKDMLTIIELDNAAHDSYGFGEFQVDSMPVEHNPESIAFRITGPNGRSVVYSGDTGHTGTLVELAGGSDVLICESAFPDDLPVKGHLTPSEAGDIATQAGVNKLVLTHFYPECDQADIETECRRTYSGPLVLAEDLMQIII